MMRSHEPGRQPLVAGATCGNTCPAPGRQPLVAGATCGNA